MVGKLSQHSDGSGASDEPVRQGRSQAAMAVG